MPLATCCEAVACEPLFPCQERTMATLSIRVAIKGIFSQITVPGTLVLIGFHSPRISAGALGLGSNVSKWLAPPARKIKMHEISRFPLFKPLPPATRKTCGSPNPNMPTPICNAARRETSGGWESAFISGEVKRSKSRKLERGNFPPGNKRAVDILTDRRVLTNPSLE